MQYFLGQILCHGVLENNLRSSIESEYKAVADATIEIMWIQILLWEIGVKSPLAAKILCDNIGVKYLLANPVFHARTKHIEVDYHFVRERVLQKLLEIDYVSTNKDQVADGFMMVLSVRLHENFKYNLNLTRLWLRGCIRQCKLEIDLESW
jgi:hypothetical protein